MPAKNSSSSSSNKSGDRLHDAGSGKFVTPGYAKAHPSTTFKESSRGGGAKKSK
jgi:hypothetical protein